MTEYLQSLLEQASIRAKEAIASGDIMVGARVLCDGKPAFVSAKFADGRCVVEFEDEQIETVEKDRVKYPPEAYEWAKL